MSYILDALKRADAERERGQVPGLHAQPMSAPIDLEPKAGGLPRWALAAGGGVGLVVVAALAWRMGADANAPLPVANVAPPVAAPVQQQPLQQQPVQQTLQEAPPQPVAQAQPEPAPQPVMPPPAVAQAQPAAAPPPVAYTPPPAPRPRPAPPAPAPKPAPAVQASPKPAPPAADSGPIPMYAALPGTLRQQLPALAVSGSVYSDDVTARFILLNGEVAKEGSQPSPGLVVERIEPKSAVLRYQGQRFRLPY